jgi:ribosomal protein L37E
MRCTSCGSGDLRKYKGEIAIKLAEHQNVEESVFVFPELVVCLACGFARFTVPERELRLLAQGNTAPGLSHD